MENILVTYDLCEEHRMLHIHGSVLGIYLFTGSLVREETYFSENTAVYKIMIHTADSKRTRTTVSLVPYVQR